MAEGKAPPGFQMDEKIMKKFKNASYWHPFRTIVKKSNWTENWLKEFAKNKWPSNMNHSEEVNGHNHQSNENEGTFVTSNSLTVFPLNTLHPLRNEILLDNGADGHVCNNLGLATSLIPTISPTFIQAGVGSCQICQSSYDDFPWLTGRHNVT